MRSRPRRCSPAIVNQHIARGCHCNSPSLPGGYRGDPSRAERGGIVSWPSARRSHALRDPAAVDALIDGKVGKGGNPIFQNGVTNGAYKLDLGTVKSMTLFAKEVYPRIRDLPGTAQILAAAE